MSLRAKAKTLDVLSNHLRLRILERLRRGPRCVCKIYRHVGADQSNVSHQLAALKKAGVLRSEKRGPWMWYRVADPRIFQIIDLAVACVTGHLSKHQQIVPARSKKGK